MGNAESFCVGIFYVFHVLAYFLLISLFLLYRVNVISISPMFPELLVSCYVSVLEKVPWAAWEVCSLVSGCDVLETSVITYDSRDHRIEEGVSFEPKYSLVFFEHHYLRPRPWGPLLIFCLPFSRLPNLLSLRFLEKIKNYSAWLQKMIVFVLRTHPNKSRSS